MPNALYWVFGAPAACVGRRFALLSRGSCAARPALARDFMGRILWAGLRGCANTRSAERRKGRAWGLRWTRSVMWGFYGPAHPSIMTRGIINVTSPLKKCGLGVGSPNVRKLLSTAGDGGVAPVGRAIRVFPVIARYARAAPPEPFPPNRCYLDDVGVGMDTETTGNTMLFCAASNQTWGAALDERVRNGS